MSNKKQERKEIIMEELMDFDLPDDEFEELTGIDLDEIDDDERCFDFDDEISETDLLDADIEAKGLNPRCMEDVEKYFKMKEGEEK